MTTTTITATGDQPAVDARAGSTRRVERRREIYEARRRVWAVTSLGRVRNCGWAPRSDDGVAVRVTECEGTRRAGLAGVQTCGSFWSCPVCSEKIALTRQGQIERVLRWWGNYSAGPVGDAMVGGRVALLTLTVSHKPWNSLASVWDAVTAAWKAVISGRAWKREQLDHGVLQLRQIRSGKRAGQWTVESRVRTVRVVEVTHGRNGWHVHLHVLLFLSRDATDSSVAALTEGMGARWRAAAYARLNRMPDEAHGVDAKLLHGDPSAALGDYFVKASWSASHEVAGGMRKTARHGNRTPFAILRDVVEPALGSPVERAEEDFALWREWEQTSKGRRAVAFSPGLLAEAEEADLTDEEIVDADLEGEVVAVIGSTAWGSIRRHNGICDLLEAFEDSTAAGLALLSMWESFAEPLRG